MPPFEESQGNPSRRVPAVNDRDWDVSKQTRIVIMRAAAVMHTNRAVPNSAGQPAARVSLTASVHAVAGKVAIEARVALALANVLVARVGVRGTVLAHPSRRACCDNSNRAAIDVGVARKHRMFFARACEQRRCVRAYMLSKALVLVRERDAASA